MDAGTLLATPAAAVVPASDRRHGALNIRALTPSKSFRFPTDHRHLRSRRSDRRVRSSAVAVASEQETPVQLNRSSELDLFSCPICYEPLIRKGPPGLNLASVYRSGFKCQKCEKSFSSKDIYLDLTVTAGATEYNEFKPARTELFSILNKLWDGWTVTGYILCYPLPGYMTEYVASKKVLKLTMPCKECARRVGKTNPLLCVPNFWCMCPYIPGV